MKTAIKKFILLFLPAFLLFSGNVLAAPLKKVRAAFSAFAYANPPFWIAKDLVLFVCFFVVIFPLFFWLRLCRTRIFVAATVLPVAIHKRGRIDDEIPRDVGSQPSLFGGTGG